MNNIKNRLLKEVSSKVQDGMTPINVLKSFPDERFDDVKVTFIPKTVEELDNFIKTCPRDLMLELGPLEWCNFNDNVDYLEEGEYHYLFPIEWYEFIPEGYIVVDINGYEGEFYKKEFDNKPLYGLLSIGFIRKEKL